jgi:hypothetical protein
MAKPVKVALAYPLHQRSLTFVQRQGRAVCLVGGLCVGLLGVLFLAGGRRDDAGSPVGVGVVLMVVAATLLIGSRFVGRFTARAGMVTVQPDRLEIADDRRLGPPLLLLRHRIVAVCAPGQDEAPPGLRRQIGEQADVLVLGDRRPNVEIWLVDPLPRPMPVAPPGWPRRQVIAVQMLTPGASTMIEWFHRGLSETPPTPWFDVSGDLGLRSKAPHELE